MGLRMGPCCAYCGEEHHPESMCPPHEVRRGTGPWSRQPQKPVTSDTIATLQRENAALKALLRECRDYVEECRGEAEHAAAVTYRGYPRAQRYEREVADCDGLMARIDAIAPSAAPGLEQFAQDLAAKQTPLTEDAAKVLRENLWELYDGKSAAPGEGA